MVRARVLADGVAGVLKEVGAGLPGETVHGPSLPRARNTRSMPPLPSGTVTFVFSDVECSTAVLTQLGEGFDDVLTTHRRLMRDGFAEHGGVEIDTQGDAFFFAFSR